MSIALDATHARTSAVGPPQRTQAQRPQAQRPQAQRPQAQRPQARRTQRRSDFWETDPYSTDTHSTDPYSNVVPLHPGAGPWTPEASWVRLGRPHATLAIAAGVVLCALLWLGFGWLGQRLEPEAGTSVVATADEGPLLAASPGAAGLLNGQAQGVQGVERVLGAGETLESVAASAARARTGADYDAALAALRSANPSSPGPGSPVLIPLSVLDQLAAGS